MSAVKLNKLVALDLSNNSIGPQGAQKLFPDLVATHIKISSLNLSSNELGFYGLEALKPFLVALKGLEHLILGKNDFRPDAIKAFSDILKNYSLLKELDISCSYFDPQSMADLSRAANRLTRPCFSLSQSKSRSITVLRPSCCAF